MTREELLTHCTEMQFIVGNAPPDALLVGTTGIVKVIQWTDGCVHLVGWADVWDPREIDHDNPTITEMGHPTVVEIDSDNPPLKHIIDTSGFEKDPSEPLPEDVETVAASEVFDDPAPPPAPVDEPAVDIETLTPSGTDEFDVLYRAWFSGSPGTLKQAWDQAVAASQASPDVSSIVLILAGLITGYRNGRPVAKVVGAARKLLGVFVKDLEGDVTDLSDEIGKGFDAP
jgi:hypothetical protein